MSLQVSFVETKEKKERAGSEFLPDKKGCGKKTREKQKWDSVAVHDKLIGKLNDAIYTGKRDVRTFAELSHAADILMQTAQEYLRGNLYTALSSLLLRAFTFEAYLNHLGERHLNLWDARKHLRWFEKFNKICKRLNFTPDELARPYSTLRPLFEFRNLMAHGKSETINEEKEVNSRDADKYWWPLTKWEKFCTPENVERAKQDITAIIIELHKQAGLSDNPFAPPEASASVRLKQK